MIFGHRMRERRKSRKKEKRKRGRKEREIGKKAKKREQNRGEIKKTESYWLEDNTIIEEKDKKVDCYEEVDR